MNRAIWDEAMDALWNSGVSQGRRRHDGRTCDCPPCGGSCLEGERQKEREETIQSIRAEIENRLDANPPPVVEAFSWVDSYDELQVRLMPISPPEAFMPMRADKTRRFMLFEIPEHWKIPEEWE